MQEDSHINSLQSKLDTYDNIEITGLYKEPNNDIIKACLNQIDNTSQQFLENWKNSFHNTKSLSLIDGGEIIQRLQVQMFRQNHKAIDDKHKYESTHE